jgi:broad specificity phosphatase PhoE
MSDPPARVYLVRHGETAWSLTGQHTGRNDIPLTPNGEAAARKLAPRLQKLTFSTVYSSPLQRAKRTCELAGYGARAQFLPDLMEWNYGDYEGVTGADIRVKRPGWNLFRDGCPGGEHLADVIARADRILPLLRTATGDVIVFSHGHLLRVLAMRWADLPPDAGMRFSIDPASLSILTTDPHTKEPVLERWNDVSHLSP